MRYYAGIGSRRTPVSITTKMSMIAKYLAGKDFVLTSGGADGADDAFEKGAGDKKQIFLPFNKFNGRTVDNDKFFTYHEDSYAIASRFYRNLANAKLTTQKMMCRNVHQVLGLDLKTPVEFVVCWTPSGEIEGGTGMAMRVAKGYNIPVYNLQKDMNIFLEKIKEM